MMGTSELTICVACAVVKSRVVLSLPPPMLRSQVEPAALLALMSALSSVAPSNTGLKATAPDPWVPPKAKDAYCKLYWGALAVISATLGPWYICQ